MKPAAWATLKALQRANKRAPLDKGAHIDAMRLRLGMRPQFGTAARSRKMARKAREKGK